MLLNGDRVSVDERDERVLEMDGGAGHTTMWTHIMLQN